MEAETNILKRLFTAIEQNNLEILKELINAGADINLQNNRGYTPLIYASLYAHVEIVKELIKANADVNIKGNNGDTPLFFASRDGHLEIVKELIKANADVNIENIYGDTPLFYASREGRLEVVKELIKSNADINIKNNNGYTPLIYVSFYGHLEVVKELIKANAEINLHNNNGDTALLFASREGHLEIVKELIKANADVNIENIDAESPLFSASLYGRLEVVKELLNTPTLDKTAVIQGKTIEEHAKGGKFKPEINEYIIDFLSSGTRPLWKGWSQGDVEKFDTIFDEENVNNYSSCPVCLKFVERRTGCMYMLDHSCANLGGYYNKKLYNNYKSPEGFIQWCTICGRISNEHRHYELGPATANPPNLLPRGDPFENDCRISNSGGGPLEKVARIRRLREYALEVQEDIGKRTEDVVLNELVEEMWNAPLQRKRIVEKIQREKKWNIPSTNFPKILVSMNTGPTIIRNIKRPEPNASNPNLQPVRHEPGYNQIELQEKPLVIQFRHRKEDGTINNHIDEYIGPASLSTFLEDSLKRFENGTGIQEFGMCWNYEGGCTARLYPEEVKPFISEELYNNYKEKFNVKFQQRGGRSKKTRKLRYKKIKGGNYGNIFTEATDATCYLPRRNATRKISGGKRRRKITRKRKHKKYSKK